MRVKVLKLHNMVLHKTLAHPVRSRLVDRVHCSMSLDSVRSIPALYSSLPTWAISAAHVGVNGTYAVWVR